MIIAAAVIVSVVAALLCAFTLAAGVRGAGRGITDLRSGALQLGRNLRPTLRALIQRSQAQKGYAQVDLGDRSQYYYNTELGRYVERGKEAEAEAEKQALLDKKAPPKLLFTSPSQTTSGQTVTKPPSSPFNGPASLRYAQLPGLVSTPTTPVGLSLSPGRPFSPTRTPFGSPKVFVPKIPDPAPEPQTLTRDSESTTEDLEPQPHELSKEAVQELCKQEPDQHPSTVDDGQEFAPDGQEPASLQHPEGITTAGPASDLLPDILKDTARSPEAPQNKFIADATNEEYTPMKRDATDGCRALEACSQAFDQATHFEALQQGSAAPQATCADPGLSAVTANRCYSASEVSICTHVAYQSSCQRYGPGPPHASAALMCYTQNKVAMYGAEFEDAVDRYARELVACAILEVVQEGLAAPAQEAPQQQAAPSEAEFEEALDGTAANLVSSTLHELLQEGVGEAAPRQDEQGFEVVVAACAGREQGGAVEQAPSEAREADNEWLCHALGETQHALDISLAAQAKAEAAAASAHERAAKNAEAKLAADAEKAAMAERLEMMTAAAQTAFSMVAAAQGAGAAWQKQAVALQARMTVAAEREERTESSARARCCEQQRQVEELHAQNAALEARLAAQKFSCSTAQRPEHSMHTADTDALRGKLARLAQDDRETVDALARMKASMDTLRVKLLSSKVTKSARTAPPAAGAPRATLRLETKLALTPTPKAGVQVGLEGVALGSVSGAGMGAGGGEAVAKVPGASAGLGLGPLGGGGALGWVDGTRGLRGSGRGGEWGASSLLAASVSSPRSGLESPSPQKARANAAGYEHTAGLWSMMSLE